MDDIVARNLFSVEEDFLYPSFDEACAHHVKLCHERVISEINLLDKASEGIRPAGDLILGFVDAHSPESIEPFVLSLRRNGYGGSIILVTLQADIGCGRLLSENNVVVHSAWEASLFPMHSSLAILLFYYEILRSMRLNGKIFERVMLADVKNVVFQSDPFCGIPSGGALPREAVCLFLEDGSATIGGSYWDATAIYRGFGKTTLAEMRNHRLSHNGAVIGSGQGIMRYLLLMQKESFECSQVGRIASDIGQAVHNFLIHRYNVPTIENGEYVWAVGCIPSDSIFITQNRKLADHRGRVCPIIYQYDRHEQLRLLVKMEYSLNGC